VNRLRSIAPSSTPLPCATPIERRSSWPPIFACPSSVSKSCPTTSSPSGSRTSRSCARERTPLRRQPQQPRATDRRRLRPAESARPERGWRGVRVGLGLGGRQPLLEAPLRADLAAVRDLAAHLARSAWHLLHGLLDAKPALPRARVGHAGCDL